MAKSYRSAVVAASADEVWSVVRDFNGLPDWHPGLASSELERGGSGAEVGAVRKLEVAGGGGTIREQLVTLDDTDRRYTYDILESPFPVRSYRSTIRIAPVTATGQAFVEWWSDYDCDGNDEKKLDETFGGGVYETGLNALKSRFGG